MSKNYQLRLTNQGRDQKCFSVVQRREKGYEVLFSEYAMAMGYLICNLTLENTRDCSAIVSNKQLNVGDITDEPRNGVRLDPSRERTNYTNHMDGSWSVSPY